MAKRKKTLGEKETEDRKEKRGVIWYTGNLEWDFSRDGWISLGQVKRKKSKGVWGSGMWKRW